MKELRVIKSQVQQPRRGGAIRAIGVFTLGAATGGMVALLFAPASGKVTRRRIGLKLRAAQKSAVRQIGQAQRVLARKAATLRSAAAERLTDARQWMGHAVNGNGHSRRAHAHHS